MTLAPAGGGWGDLMESQQLFCLLNTAWKRHAGGEAAGRTAEENKTLQAYDIPAGHLWVALIVNTTFILYLKLHNDIYCERPVQIYSLQVCGKDDITSGRV